MKPDAYMPFYGNDFFGATSGFSDTQITAYLRAVWYYWHHESCRGLKDDDDFLRRICRVEKSDWQDVRDTVFDNAKFFAQDENGLWHQKRAFEEWQKSEKSYTAAVNGGKNRWKKISKEQRSAIAANAISARWNKPPARPNTR